MQVVASLNRLTNTVVLYVFQLCYPPDETDPARPRQRNLHQAPGGGEGEERQLRPRGLGTRFLPVFGFPLGLLVCDSDEGHSSRTLSSFFTFSLLQISALDREIIEVDPDTKDMLKMLVSATRFVISTNGESQILHQHLNLKNVHSSKVSRHQLRLCRTNFMSKAYLECITHFHIDRQNTLIPFGGTADINSSLQCVLASL